MKRQLILHDLPQAEAREILPAASADVTIFSALPMAKSCIGCFGCWTKNPGACVIKDRATEFPVLMATHQELIVISRMVFGSLSPEIKGVLDRSIGFILPYFRIVGGEMHHVQRYGQAPKLTYAFYGPGISRQEEETAKRLVAANGINFDSRACSAAFFNDRESLREVFA